MSWNMAQMRTPTDSVALPKVWGGAGQGPDPSGSEVETRALGWTHVDGQVTLGTHMKGFVSPEMA